MNTIPIVAGDGPSNVVCSTVKQSNATLESINDDCLRVICQYLNIMEVAKLSATCTRLEEFATDCLFPKIAKKVTILLKDKRYISNEELTIDMMGVAQLFESFGSFVEQLTIHVFRFEWCDVEPRLKGLRETLFLCPNLSSLHMEGITLPKDTLNYVATGLHELKILWCNGITDDGSQSLQYFSKLQHLTLNVMDEMTPEFFKNIANLTTLNLSGVDLVETDLERIFDQNGHSLKQLELHFDNDYCNMHFDKLQKLEKLGINKICVELPNSIIALPPHLKTLKVYGSWDSEFSVTSLLRKVIEIGTIENLAIFNILDDFPLDSDEEDENAPPLVFNKLLSLETRDTNSPEFIQIFTNAEMPDITSLTCNGHFPEDVLDLVESKITTLMVFNYYAGMDDLVPFSFVLKLIEILKPNIGHRPCFYLNLIQLIGLKHTFNEEEMKVLKDNRHLIKVNVKEHPATFCVPY